MNLRLNISLSKNIAALMVLVSCGNAFSAEGVQCRRLLMNEGMVEAAVISDFAKLKFDLDMSQIRGKHNGPSVDMSTALSIAFDRKIQEFVKSSNGKISEDSLREMIREEILRTQNPLRSDEVVKKSSVRKVEKDALKLERMAFSFKERIERPEFATVQPDYFAEYIPEAKSFFWLVPNKDRDGNSVLGFSLNRFDIEKRTVTTERNDITAMTLLEDGKQALLMTRSGETEIVDLTTMIVNHRVTTKLGDRILNFATEIRNKTAVVAVNASETILAVSEGWKIYFFDIRSGDYLGAFEEHSGFTSYVRNIHFISDREVIFNKAGFLVKMNIDTLENTSVEVFRNTVTVTGLEVSHDKKTISMMNLNSVVTIRTSDLNVGNPENIFSASGGSQTRMLKRVVGSSNHLIHIGGRDASRVGIYPQDDMTIPSFSFGKYPIQSFQGNDVLAISIPLDRSHAIVVGLDKKKPFLDVWNYAE